MRRLAEEQKKTYVRQEEAAAQLKELNDAQAAAAKQTELTQTRVDVEIAGNRGEAQLAEAQRLARRDVARALGESRSQELLGKGQGARIAQVGLSEASVLLQKVRAYGDPRLFAVNTVSDNFAKSAQPIVPERLFVLGGGNGSSAGTAQGATNIVSQLLALLLAEKAGLGVGDAAKGIEDLERIARDMAQRAAEGPAPGAQQADLSDEFDKLVDREMGRL
jgi:hypothetical protein